MIFPTRFSQNVWINDDDRTEDGGSDPREIRFTIIVLVDMNENNYKQLDRDSDCALGHHHRGFSKSVTDCDARRSRNPRGKRPPGKCAVRDGKVGRTAEKKKKKNEMNIVFYGTGHGRAGKSMVNEGRFELSGNRRRKNCVWWWTIASVCRVRSDDIVRCLSYSRGRPVAETRIGR